MKLKKPDTGRLETDGDRLWWIDSGDRKPVEDVVRCFPNTTPDRWSSLRSEGGVELALIQDIAHLDQDQRGILEPVLEDKYHTPSILRIHAIESIPAGKQLNVETSDGPDTLDINGETDADFGTYPRVVFTDRGKRRKYVIEDVALIDKHSRDLIRQHLRTPGRRGRRFR